MKAVLLDVYGGPEVLRFADAPDPAPGPDDVVVDTHAASVNAADYMVRLGKGRHPVILPHILGRDFSGIVGAVGTGVTDVAVGDAVFGVTVQTREGTYAEKIAIPAAIVAPKPDRLSHLEAAAMGLAGLTALCAIEDTLRLEAGETILIQGGAGGVGGFAIQLAKHLGAVVITTASAGNHDYVRGLGADRVIDYMREDFTAIGPVCDAVFDTVGGEVLARSFAVLRPGGRITWVGNAPAAFEPPRVDVRAGRPEVRRDRAHLEAIAALVEAGAVRPPAITPYKLWEAAEAHRVSESRHLRGKLVFEIR